jgi:NAD(P)-dependent dehydrogenase (short-subunit alcohol dehydrogenase family)
MKISDIGHAFVTGGASGIGLGAARGLAARGIAVTIADFNPDALADVLAEGIAKIRGVQMDVRDRAAWAKAKAEAEAEFGPVGLLISNAGIASVGYELADMDPESFDRIVGVNLFGAFNGISAFAADMRGRGRGHIVSTASIVGLASPKNGVGGNYVASKFGIVGLSEVLRMEMAPHGVGVSLMCPGLVMTNLPENTAKIGGNLRPGGKMPGGLDAGVAGEMAVRGIERGQFYILTSFDRDEPIRRRFEEQLAAFAAGPDADLTG